MKCYPFTAPSDHLHTSFVIWRQDNKVSSPTSAIMKRSTGVIRSALEEYFARETLIEATNSSRERLLAWGQRKGRSIEPQADELYLPIFEYISTLKKELFPSTVPLFLGISAPQGAGKTTMTTALQYLLEMDGKRCQVLSLDDFYLTYDDQCALAKKYEHNPLLQYRGNAGTHDIDLLLQVLHRLRNLSTGSSSERVLIPRYDKSLQGGRGDRAPVASWSVVEKCVDIVLVEGWMLGFNHISPNEDATLCKNMVDVNEFLLKYKDIHFMINAWIIIEAEDIDLVYRWRQEAEKMMASSGKSALSESENGPGHNEENSIEKNNAPCPILQIKVGANRAPRNASLKLL